MTYIYKRNESSFCEIWGFDGADVNDGLLGYNITDVITSVLMY